MSILDSREEIAKLDRSNLLGSVEALPDQIEDAWEQTQNLKFPDTFPNVKNIIVSGMGGSNLGSLIIKRLFKDQLTLPIEVYPHYNLPAYVNQDSLVLLSSYSGTTEETLEAAEQAKKAKAKIAVITAGGTLADMAKANNWPMYLINPKYNPSNQPRMAIGYAVFGQLSMFAKMGLINISSKEVENLVDRLHQLVNNLTVENKNSPAKHLAYIFYDKHIIFVGAEHLVGATHVWNNQVNENAKALTSEWHLPEFNHHYLEALSQPKSIKENTIFILVNSSLYHERVQKRVILTKQAIEEKGGYEVQLIQATAPTKLEQVFEIVQLGEFVAAYLPILYGIPDPGPVPNVEWFKAEMKK